jgi:hypothetical protein
MGLRGQRYCPVAAYLTAQATGHTHRGASAIDAARFNVRFEKETGAITMKGRPVATDRISQSLITGAYNAAQRDPRGQ